MQTETIGYCCPKITKLPTGDDHGFVRSTRVKQRHFEHDNDPDNFRIYHYNNSEQFSLQHYNEYIPVFGQNVIEQQKLAALISVLSRSNCSSRSRTNSRGGNCSRTILILLLAQERASL